MQRHFYYELDERCMRTSILRLHDVNAKKRYGFIFAEKNSHSGSRERWNSNCTRNYYLLSVVHMVFTGLQKFFLTWIEIFSHFQWRDHQTALLNTYGNQSTVSNQQSWAFVNKSPILIGLHSSFIIFGCTKSLRWKSIVRIGFDTPVIITWHNCI